MPLISVFSAAAASYAGYATMAPQSQLYGRTLAHGANPDQVALTFDDGPNDPHTLRLLDVLARHEAKATFFLVGKYVRQRPDIVRAIVAAGHEIGNHTYSHPNLIFLSRWRVRQELEDCNKALADELGQKPVLFRPPFGGRRPAVLSVARDLGMKPVMWSVTGYDWNATSVESILGKVAPRLKSRRAEIVLLHDGGHLAFGADRSHTVEAARRLLEMYPNKRFVSVSMLEATRIKA
ncbi:MAG TPA: polysaccharide deacetylase family protein [Candidatus Angelobacter sp.]|nr:polysaccharide deacetylase family protein [Candidatus Angelobacter sp.]